MTYPSTKARRRGSADGSQAPAAATSRRQREPAPSRQGRSASDASRVEAGRAAAHQAGTGRTGRRPSSAPSGRRASATVAGAVVWAGASTAAVAVGQPAIEVVAIPVAVVAAVSAIRSSQVRPPSGPGGRRAGGLGWGFVQVAVAAAGASLVPLAALGGPSAGVAALCAMALLALLCGPGRGGEWGLAGGRVGRLVAVAGPAAGAMSLVLARGQGSSDSLALLGAVFAYDLGSSIMGNSRTPTGGPVGVVFGLAGVGVVAMFVAALMNPPFAGSRPWIAFAAVGVMAAAGVVIGGRVAGGSRLPALRRLDSLMLAGPAWVIAIAVIQPR